MIQYPFAFVEIEKCQQQKSIKHVLGEYPFAFAACLEQVTIIRKDVAYIMWHNGIDSFDIDN